MSPTPKKADKKPTKKPTAKAKPKAEPKPEPKAEPKPAPQAAAEPAAELIDITRLAVELHQPLLQVRKMIQTGQIPGVKVEGEWRFNLQLVREAMLRRSRGR